MIVLAGIDSSKIVDAALNDGALTEAALVRFEPSCTAPCDALLWRLETASGQGLNHAGLITQYWHRPPYAMTVRLVRYQPGSQVPEILDEATIGTRGKRVSFQSAVERVAMRLVRDAALGRSRGPAGVDPAPAAHGLPGWLERMRAKWHARVMVEWWSIGTSSAPPKQVLLGGGLGRVNWYNTELKSRYLADPFPWPGSNRILCAETPIHGGVGRIVSVTKAGDGLTASKVVLDDQYNHSYPCTLQDGEQLYCVPETTLRGATRIFRLEDGGKLTAVCDPAPNLRLADPTLFTSGGLFWLACTDLDLGEYDNLCLLHAPTVAGPWTPHAQWPVRIDVRGTRSAGMLFKLEDRLFRPGQDRSLIYGAPLVIHEVLTLTETEYRERVVAVLRPDAAGPFRHGIHTLMHDGEQFWVDGKRFELDLSSFRRKAFGKMSRSFGKGKAS